MKTTQVNNTKRMLSLYWRAATKYKTTMLLLYGSMPIIQVAEETIAPLFIASILNKLASGSFDQLTTDKVLPTLAIIIALEFFGHIAWTIFVWFYWEFSEKVMRDLNVLTFDHLTKMSYRFYSDSFAGSLVNQASKFVGSFDRLLEVITWNVLKLIIGTVATCVVLAPKAPIVVIGILALSAIYIPVIWIFRRRQVPYNRKWAAAETRRTGQIADSITNILAVKAFSNEKLEHKLFKERLDDVYDNSIATRNISMKQEFVSGTVQRSLNVFVIAFSIWLAVTHRIEVGVVYLSLEYTRNILRRLWDLNSTFRSITRVLGDANDMTAILDIKPEVADPFQAKPIFRIEGKLTFDNITFSYPGVDEPLFKDFNLAIKPGEKVGLVGHSGSGKTSLTKLALRFMDVEAGQIMLDDHNIAEIKQSDARRLISYVPQEPLLFHRSIAENISYGKMNATQKDIEKAAKLAHAHEFIKGLPQGYKTLVGERGVKLSGGQKQRVAIARTLLKDAPILVLDEATSALDSESEQLIQDALWKLMEGRTAMVIAHRLSTIQKMDRIVVLDQGKIVEEGSHRELIAKKGVYAKLWSHQSGGFLED